MPASLCEAFAVSTICGGSGTESLHNPRYRPEAAGLQQQPQLQLQPQPQPQPQPQQHQQMMLSQQRQQQQQQQQQQMQSQQMQSQQMQQSHITLDDETKCDLHIYHILSCQHCREKLRGILGSPVPTPTASAPALTPNYGHSVGNGLMNITIEDLRSLLMPSSPSSTSNIEKLILYIVLAIFVVYLIDIYMRK
jgi:hypothetical protein